MLPRMSRMVYGKRPVMEALRFQTGQVQQLLVDQSKAKILSEVLDLAKKVGVKAQWTSRAQLDQLTQGGNHQGAALTVREFDYTSIKDFLAGAGKNAQVVVALDGVTDPQNLGSCLRAAGAFGADLVIITKDRSAQVNAATTRAAAGATEAVPIARETNLVRALEQLQQAGFWVYGLAVEGARAIGAADLRGKVVLVLGSEGEGMRRLVAQTCDELVHLNANGPIESLNVGQACAVALYEVFHQKGRATDK